MPIVRPRARGVFSRRAAIALFMAAPIAARAQTATPGAFLQGLYSPYGTPGFKGQPYWEAGRWFVPDLAAAIEKDFNESLRRGEPPKLNGDPFVDAQDWKIGDLALTVTGGEAKARGEIGFDNGGRRVDIVVDLARTPAGWRIFDILAPSGSLRSLYGLADAP